LYVVLHKVDRQGGVTLTKDVNIANTRALETLLSQPLQL